MTHSVQSLFIRADAGGTLGTGHVMRMLALSQAWQDRGGEVHLAAGSCPEGLVERLESEGIHFHPLVAKELGGKEDIKETLELGRAVGSEWIVLDGYHFSLEYQRAGHQAGFKVMIMDDFGHCERWCADLILNQNLGGEGRQYANEVKDAICLLGSQYCLLRKEFLRPQATRKKWKRIERLLVSLGGSDPENATAATLNLLHSVCERPLEIRVLSGIDNPHIEQLRKFESHHTIDIQTNVRDMPAQLDWADGIVSAGGSTCWEWLHFGLPGAIVTLADNQLPIVKALTESRRAALPLGWVEELNRMETAQALAFWLESPESRVESTAARLLIDGLGSFRVAGILSKESSRSTITERTWCSHN